MVKLLCFWQSCLNKLTINSLLLVSNVYKEVARSFNKELKCHLMQNIICFSGTCCYIIEELQLVSNGITWCIMLLMLLLHNWTSSWLLWPHANRCNELSLFNSQFCRSYSDLLGYFGHGCLILRITYLVGSKIS